MDEQTWRAVAAAQMGLITRAQLRAVGVDHWQVRNRIASERWVLRSDTVVATFTGELTRLQVMWLGVLHAGRGALIGDLTAAEVHGLRNWAREEVTVLVPQNNDLHSRVPGIRFARTRRPLPTWRSREVGLPVCHLAPAILHFGGYQPSRRTAQGVVAAAVQQRLATVGELAGWVDRMRPLRFASTFRAALADIAGGSHSLAEMDIRRMCRAYGLSAPRRQTRRRDVHGRLRYTDCEWTLPDGRTLVLEVDGAFHMDVANWEDDLARQRALTDPRRVVIRCTAREVRDEAGRLATELRLLGVPRAA